MVAAAMQLGPDHYRVIVVVWIPGVRTAPALGGA